jgi:hypothetical protein
MKNKVCGSINKVKVGALDGATKHPRGFIIPYPVSFLK